MKNTLTVFVLSLIFYLIAPVVQAQPPLYEIGPDLACREATKACALGTAATIGTTGLLGSGFFCCITGCAGSASLEICGGLWCIAGGLVMSRTILHCCTGCLKLSETETPCYCCFPAEVILYPPLLNDKDVKITIPCSQVPIENETKLPVNHNLPIAPPMAYSSLF